MNVFPPLIVFYWVEDEEEGNGFEVINIILYVSSSVRYFIGFGEVLGGVGQTHWVTGLS